MALWLCGPVALWLSGSLALSCGSVPVARLWLPLWLCGSVALWLCDFVTLWLCGSRRCAVLRVAEYFDTVLRVAEVCSDYNKVSDTLRLSLIRDTAVGTAAWYAKYNEEGAEVPASDTADSDTGKPGMVPHGEPGTLSPRPVSWHPDFRQDPDLLRLLDNNGAALRILGLDLEERFTVRLAPGETLAQMRNIARMTGMRLRFDVCLQLGGTVQKSPPAPTPECSLTFFEFAKFFLHKFADQLTKRRDNDKEERMMLMRDRRVAQHGSSWEEVSPKNKRLLLFDFSAEPEKICFPCGGTNFGVKTCGYNEGSCNEGKSVGGGARRRSDGAEGASGPLGSPRGSVEEPMPWAARLFGALRRGNVVFRNVLEKEEGRVFQVALPDANPRVTGMHVRQVGGHTFLWVQV